MDKALMRALRELDEYDLRRLIIYAQGLLLDTDGPKFDAPPELPGTRGTEAGDQEGESSPTYRQQYVSCGKDNCSSCPHGPYWYAYWREDGRVRSRYIGKQLPEDAEVPDGG